MLKLSDLALRPDLQFGPMLVSPSRRLAEGPGGHAHLEPLIMQVFLLLLDARGKVVTRNELFDQCWGGVVAGDDSLNRAIAKVRRTGAHVAPGLYEVETIPRTGYRLTGEILGFMNGGASAGHPAALESGLSRRLLVGGAAVAGVAAATGGIWWLRRPSRNPRFDALMTHGDEAFRNGTAFDQADIRSNHSPSMVELYSEAVGIEPDSAKAWGLLAYFKSASAVDASSDDSPKAVAQAELAIRRALAIDPKEPNARVGMYMLQGLMLDWAGRDQMLRDILKTDPNNLPAMFELMPLVQAAGLTRESWMWNERILKASPFLRASLAVRALKLWILGRVREADNVINRVRGLWPDYQFAFYARFIIFILTNRASAGRAMISTAPPGFYGFFKDPKWPVLLDALETRAPSAINAARIACEETVRTSPASVNDMIMILCALGLKETAFEATEGFLLWRGKLVSQDQRNGKTIDDYNRRMTQWLFTPPCKIMRDDPRFEKLCDDFGLTAYWRARNVQPDYKVYG